MINSMRIIIAYDSEEKTAQILMDGKEVPNISNVSLCKCSPNEEEYDLNIMRQTIDDTGIVNTQTWCCYASKNKNSNPVQDLFKKIK